MKILDNGITYIYCLADPSGDIRYASKSNNPVRYIDHLKKSKYKKYIKDRWVKSLLENNQKLELIILDSVPYCEFGFWEKFYIQFFKKIIHQLIMSCKIKENY